MSPPSLERRLRQRSALAEFALRVLGASDRVSMAEAATEAVAEGTGLEHAAVFERKSYGLDLLASTGWPAPEGIASEPPIAALRALTQSEAVTFSSSGEATSGVATSVDGLTQRLLVATSPESVSLDRDDLGFVTDVAAVLTGAFRRAATETSLRESEARARSSEARAHAILDTTVDGIITINDRGEIESFNPAAEHIFGYRAAEVVGRNVSMLMPEPYTSHHDGYVRSYLQTGHRKIIGIGREVVGRRRDGATFPMELAVSEVVVPGVRLFTGIVRDITVRRELEREVIEGIEEERRRLGQELHDELGQSLSGIRMLTLDLARRLGAGEPPSEEDVIEIADHLHEADQKARTLARGLVLVHVDAEGLSASLRLMATQVQRLFGIPVEATSQGAPVLIPDVTATHLYRIAQEATTNAARHASPSSLSVRLAWAPEAVRLTVDDDGVGVEETTSSSSAGHRRRSGLGIQTMIYRARLMGGVLHIGPRDDGGTRVQCVVPLNLAGPNDRDVLAAP